MRAATPPISAVHRRQRSERDPQEDADLFVGAPGSPTGSMSWRESTRWNELAHDRTVPLAFGALTPQDGYDSRGANHPEPGKQRS